MRTLVAVAALSMLVGCSASFSDEDVQNVKKTIKTEFEKKPGIKVTNVSVVKESARKLTNFVTLSVDGAGDVTKSCQATMDEGGANYVWRCE